METPLNTNFVFTARRKSDGEWDAVYSGSIEDHCAKMDDVRSGESGGFGLVSGADGGHGLDECIEI